MILAFGDSHRSQNALEQIAQIICLEQPEFFVHTGDNHGDFQWLKKRTKIAGYGVRGNCDMGLLPGVREEILFEFNTRKILLTHGHRYGVKYSQDDLCRRARQLEAEAVIFGHSHVQLVLEKDGILLINPGSIPLPRAGSKAGYARITVQSSIQAELVHI